MADRVQAYNQPSAPWVGAQNDGSEGSHPDIDRRHRHRAATSPSTAASSSTLNQYRTQPAYPSSLFPGQRPPQTVHRSDIFFSSGMNHDRFDHLYSTHNGVPNAAAQFYPSHQQQFYGSQQIPASSIPSPPIPLPPKPQGLQQEGRQDARHGPLHPAMYRSFTSPPPIPPKPSLLFEPEAAAIPTSAYLGAYSAPATMATTISPEPISPPPPLPPPPPVHSGTPTVEEVPEEEGADDLAVALALSKDESMREEERLKELAQQEDEELERALAASMLTATSGHDYYDSQPGAGPSNRTPPATKPSSPTSAIADLFAEPSVSSSSSSTTEGVLEDTPDSSLQKPNSLDEEAKHEAQGTASTTEIATTSPAPGRRLSIDTSSPTEPEPLNDNDQLPEYSPESTDRTPTTTETFSSDNCPSELATPNSAPDNNNLDDDSDGLSYLGREGRDTPTAASPIGTVAAGPSQESSPKPDLSPTSASLATLSYDDSYIDEDEALARRLAEEEEAAYKESQRSHRESNDAGLSRNMSAASVTVNIQDGDLPTYHDAMSIASTDEISRLSMIVPEVRVDSASTPAMNGQGGVSRNFSIKSGTSVASEPIPNGSTISPAPFPRDEPLAVTLQPDEPQRIIGRTSSLSALPSANGVHDDSNDLPLTPDDDLPMSSNPRAYRLSTMAPIGANAPGESGESSSGANPWGMLNANYFVDAELLHGVSIQFTPPVVSAKLSPMQGSMPTLISLPYGRCPPLHLQAPSWRHLLKLMARLSSTKMEPSIEALAVNKNETLKLRTVIQFIKPHHMSQEWRTILWFTIDHPVPPNAPNAARYHPTNVNILPWSYTLSSIPTTLRDASDNAISKTYTIPATAAVPYPSLPITFPNLALYLQAALDGSRQQSDSSPLHKLAKMVQTCYPNDFSPNGTDEPEKSGVVSGLFKKVIGRGGKKSKKAGRGGNEETYDLVTPFVPDEWC